MRVIAGSARSLPLMTPDGMDTRPTQDRIKETLFNILQWDIPDCVFIDLFAGSGGIGIEALSRGAAKAYFVDHSQRCEECIRENLRFTKLSDKAVLLRQEAANGLLSIYEKHADIIFMDPPYGQKAELPVFAQLLHSHFCDEDTVIILEEDLHFDPAAVTDLGYELTRTKKYKTNQHLFFRKKQA